MQHEGERAMAGDMSGRSSAEGLPPACGMAVAESRLIPPGLAESRIRKQSVFGPLLPDRTPGCVARLRVDARCRP